MLNLLKEKRGLSLNNKGFSLIELMIVVAIIGILATVAIPNFQTFIRRSKQAEAKSNLASIYSAQRSFEGEWNYYDGRFEHIGFSPEGDLRYQITSAAGAPTARYTARKGGSIAGASVTSLAFCGANPNQCLQDLTTAFAAPGAAVAAPPNATFVVSAGAQLGAAVPDTWTINQGRALTQTQNGE